VDTVFIYVLIDPTTEKIRYVGKTKNLPKTRLSGHITEAKKLYNNTHKSRWIRKLLKQNLKPEIEIIDEIPKYEYELWEEFYIKLLKSFGAPLVNSDETGRGNTNAKHNFKKHIDDISKNVVQYDMKGNFIGEYESMREAERKTGIDHGAISRSCIGEYNHTGEFVFKFKNSNIEGVFPVTKGNPDSKPVVEVDRFGHIINEYDSIMDASRKTGLVHYNLSRVCNNKNKSIKGRIFKFKNK